MCKIIGDFIENNDLHNDTDQLISIIMKFDDTKQSFVNDLSISSNNIEKEEFCKKTLWRIRYIFSKLGRLLNLREQTNKWLVKDNNRLLKLISKANPNFVNEMKVKKLQLVNMDSHENKNAKLELFFFFKKLMAKWKNDVDYEILKRNEVPYVWWRIWLSEILAISAEEHTILWLQRYHAKKKTREIDTKFLEILNRISDEISSMKKSKVSSAMIKKRNILESPIVNTDNALTINSPLITNRSKNRLQDLSKAYFEENKTSTPSMPPRSSELVFNKESSIEGNKFYIFSCHKITNSLLSNLSLIFQIITVIFFRIKNI